ncbi:tRNA pseudouridine(55) synthase TruB [Candidatus Nomurabacteria bacterium]|nr:tRNA pseudouridine(55) synthase TruB [Candidatus Nomurabacteria bacterium]
MIKKLSSEKIANILNDPQAGFYLVDKEKDVNSFRAVSTFRKILNQQSIGFSGTLDPLASGLLILASGKATKLLDAFHLLPKTYQAEILFGYTSDTYDLEGDLIKNKKSSEFSKVELEQALKFFLGKSLQTVPAFSAVKVNGQKLYKLARQKKEIDLPQKPIEIFSLKIKNFAYPKLFLEAKVSAGTYIRSLVSDLGENLKTGAVLTDLRRTAIGEFSIEKALPLAELKQSNLKNCALDLAETTRYLNQLLDQ